METVLTLLRKARRSPTLANRQEFDQALYLRTHGLLLSISARWCPHQSADLVNDVFALKVMPLPLSKFPDSEKGIEGLLAVIMIHHCNDHVRKRNLEKNAVAFAARKWIPGNRTSLPSSNGFLDREFLSRYLSEDQINVILLRFNEDLEYGEIQRKLDMNSTANVRQHMHRARKKLREVFSTIVW